MKFLSSLLMFLFVTSAASAINKDEFLAKLKARDRRIDNVRLQYQMKGYDASNPSLSVVGNQAADERRTINRSGPLYYLHQCQMIVREPHVIFINHLRQRKDPNEPDQADSPRILAYDFEKLAIINDVLAELNTKKDGPDIGFLRLKRAAGHELDLMRLGIELPLGFGVSRRLTEIDTLEKVQDGFKVEGRLRVYGPRDHAHACTLFFDTDYVLRKGDILIDHPLTDHGYHIETTGSRKINEFVFAKTGHFSSWRQTYREKEQGTKKIQSAFELKLKDAEFELKDSEHKKLTTFEFDERVTIHDRDNLADTIDISRVKAE